MKKSIVWAAITGIAVFTLSAAAARYIPASPFIRQLLLKLILAVLSVVAVIVIHKVPWSQFSFRGKTGKTGKYKLLAMLLGAVCTAVMLLFQLPAIPMLKQLTLWQYIIAVWVVSSIGEEIFARGMVQGIVQQHEAELQSSIPASVWTGAIVFSLIHLSIYIVGGNLYTCITIMVATLLLGLLCGMARLRGNMLSAIYTHILFNAGAFFGGMIVNIIAKITIGHLLVAP